MSLCHIGLVKDHSGRLIQGSSNLVV